MNTFKTYELGIEWHYLNEKHTTQQGGVNWHYRFGFDFNRLTPAEQRRYKHVYKQMCLARGVPAERIKFNF